MADLEKRRGVPPGVVAGMNEALKTISHLHTHITGIRMATVETDVVSELSLREYAENTFNAGIYYKKAA